MNTRTVACLLLISFGLSALPNTGRAQPTNVPLPPVISEDVRQQLRNLPPEERRAKLQELRAQRGLTNQPAQDLRSLSPEERRARIEALRQQRATNNPASARINPEAQRARLQPRLDALRAKKADGTITPQEQQQLDRLEEYVQRLEAQQKAAGTNAPVAPALPPKPTADTNAPAAAKPK